MKRRLLFSALILLLTALTLLAIATTSQKQNTSPELAIANARTAITNAMKAKSDRYTDPSLVRAQALYDSAMNNWKKENERFYLLRDFEKAKAFAEQAHQVATSAMQVAKVTENEMSEMVAFQLQFLKEKINQYEQYYGKVPLSKSLNQELANAKLLYQEGKVAFGRQDYKTSKLKLDSAEFLMAKVTSHSRHLLEDYFEEHDHWIEWMEASIAKSRKDKNSCLIIDKYARECQVYQQGKLIHTFVVELSSNWIGDKLHQGDKSTPEGTYRVTKLKSKTDTKYYKALLINYPNEEDKSRFEHHKKQGQIKPGVTIGGLIEIHGDGGKGMDWTEGCVALENQDMDILFQYARVNTPVTIVGSIRPLTKILDYSTP